MSKLVVGQWAHFDMGGASKVIQNLTKGLATLPDVELIVFYNRFSFPQKTAVSDPDSLVLCRFDGYSEFRRINISSFKTLSNYNLHILNTHRSGDDFWAFPGFDNLSFPFKVVETNFHGHTKSRADIRIVPSRELFNRVSNKKRVVVIPNPILPPATTEDLRKELKLEDKFVFGRIGRPETDVYCATNLRAYKEIEDESTHLLYVAPGRAAIQESQNLQIKNITFLPATLSEHELSKMYNTLDVMCHSNALGETFGNTIAEAMIHGKPVISHQGSENYCQAQKELLGDMSKHLFVSNNIHLYATTMSQLRSDRNFYNESACYLKNRADTLFDFRVVAKQYKKLYENSLVL